MQQLYLGAHQHWTKQADRDLVVELFSVRFGANMIQPWSVLTAESNPRFWTNPAPVGSYVHYRTRMHFPCYNSNNTPARVLLDKCGECKQCNIRWPTPELTPSSSLFIVKLLVVDALSAHLSVYITRVCQHGNSDQSESSSGSMILLPPQIQLTSEWSFFFFQYSIEPMSDVQLSLWSVFHIYN